MSRVLSALSYLVFIVREVISGSWQVVRAAVGPASTTTPGIVEFPLRCRSDLEITALASSITITPGTLVLGTAAAAGDTPPTLFVHALFGQDTEQVRADLRDMEHRVLRMTRGPHAPDPEGPPCPTAAPEAGGPVGAARHTDDRTKEAT